MTNRIGKVEQQGQGCFKWCIPGVLKAFNVMVSPCFVYRGHTFSFAHKRVSNALGYCKDGLSSSVVAAADAAGEYPKATFQLHLQCPHKTTAFNERLPVTISTTHIFSEDALECGTMLSMKQDSSRGSSDELCATVTFTQLEWSSAALADQGLQLIDSLQLQLAAAPSGAAFFGSRS
jgi:hypothetical protein